MINDWSFVAVAEDKTIQRIKENLPLNFIKRSFASRTSSLENYSERKNPHDENKAWIRTRTTGVSRARFHVWTKGSFLFTFNVRSLISQAAPPLTVNYTRNTMPLFCGAKNVPEVIHKKCYVFNLTMAVYTLPKSLTSGRRLLCLVHGNEKVKVISSRVSCNNVVAALWCVYTMCAPPPHFLVRLFEQGLAWVTVKKSLWNAALRTPNFSFGRVSNYRKNLVTSQLKFTHGLNVTI